MATKPRKPQDTELGQISNLPETVKAFGKTYSIAQFKVGQFAEVLEYAGYIGVLLVQATKLTKQPSTEEIIRFATQGVGVASPAIIPIISIAIKEPIEWIEEQDDPIGALEIFVKVVEKNRSFFTPENLERVRAIFANLLPATQETGDDSLTT